MSDFQYSFDEDVLDATRPQQATPYLDVLSITCPQSVSALHRDSHTELLIEPISIPKLDHTNVETSISANGKIKKKIEGRVFYQNGKKNKNLRQSIQAALRSLTVEESSDKFPLCLEDRLALTRERKIQHYAKERFKSGNRRSISLRKSLRKSIDQRSVASSHSTSSVISTHRPRAGEAKAEELLSSIHEEKARLDIFQF